MAFTDVTAEYRRQRAREQAAEPPRHEYRELLRRKAGLIAEADGIVAEAGPDGALPRTKLDRFEAIQGEIEVINRDIRDAEADRERRRVAPSDDELARRGHGMDLALPPEARRLGLGQIGLLTPPRSANALFGAGSMDGWHRPADFLRCVATSAYDERLQLQAAGMTSGSPSEGGFLVPQEYSDRLFDLAVESEIVRPRAQVEPMNSASKIVAGFDTLDHTGGSIGGFVVAWLSETGAATDQKGRTRRIELTAKKAAVFTRASNELAADGIDFERGLTEVLTAGLSWGLDDSFLNGDGTGRPLGVFNDPALITVAKESGQTAATIVTPNILNMWARLHPSLVGNAVWVTNSATLPQLMQAVVGAGTGVRLLYEPDPSGRTFGTLLGRPLLLTEKVPTLGAKGDLLLADFSQYVIGLRAEILLQKSMHVGWQTDESGYRIIARVDGQGRWSGPLKPKSGPTLSWCVTLEAR
jgi:HK97 family phage major capsid protein